MSKPVYEKMKNLGTLPSPTGVALKILRLAGAKNTTLEEFASVVESDPALTGRLLKLANSPLAGVSRRIASVSVAVRLLGMRSVKNLALGISLLGSHRTGRCATFNYDRFWSLSLARAVAARTVAAQLKNCPPDEAFTLGLLSKIGLLGFSTACTEEFAQLLSRNHEEVGGQLLAGERSTFGIDHHELSAEMLSDWMLPDIFCRIVRYQGTQLPAKLAADARVAQWMQILRLADAMAETMIDLAITTDCSKFLREQATALGLPVHEFPGLFDSTVKAWREAGQIFSVDTKDLPSLDQLEASLSSPAEARGETGRTLEKLTDSNNSLRILAVDDDPAALRLLEHYLSGAGYEVILAKNGTEALNIDLACAPQMVITDWHMPEMDGITLCHRLMEQGNNSFVYVIVLTAQSEKGQVIKALNAGAHDFLPKPYSREELLARVRVGHRIVCLQGELIARNRERAQYNALLSVTNEKLQALAITDELTGLFNRREVLSRLTETWSLGQRHGDQLSAIVIDIDHFKKLNDSYGHLTGDRVLQELASRLRATLRRGELISRLGGEEFLIICPRTGTNEARKAAERLRLAMASEPFIAEGRNLAVTISLGVAERSNAMAAPQDLLRAADEAMYAAKTTGRNRVCCAGEIVLPAQSRAVTTSANITPEPTPTQPLITETLNFSNAPIQVLVADDDKQIRLLSRKILERAGHVVIEAANGLEALDKIRAETPDVILMDIDMPGLDGLECTRRLKADPATLSIPVIILSAAAEAQSIEAGLEAGAEEYLTKPFRHRELVLRVRSMAQAYRNRTALTNSNTVRREQARALQVLLNLSCGLLGESDFNQLLEKIVTAAAALTSSHRVSIMLPDEKKECLKIANCIGLDKQTAAAVRVPIGGAIAGKVYETGHPIIINRPEEAQANALQYDSKFFVSVPLASKLMRVNDNVVGVLNITERENQRPFTPGEIDFIELLCNIAASAINDYHTRQECDQTRDSIVVALATLAEYRDTVTGRHLDRVTWYALRLAEELRNEEAFRGQIDRNFLQALTRSMPLHDIGKVAISDQILLKPAKLTSAEMNAMKQHTVLGSKLIQVIIERARNAGFLTMAYSISRSHHEWYNGVGYPDGLKGNQIPLAARIAALADVYDALTSKRPYKDAMAPAEASQIIRNSANSQFDPAIVAAFIRCEREFAEVAENLADDGNASFKKELTEEKTAPPTPSHHLPPLPQPKQGKPVKVIHKK